MVHATQTAALEHAAEDNDASADELVLRVCSPARRGQLVRLKSRKCSIGYAQNCTLRLAARGVQPVHCLIVRGQNATVIRCWAPDTRINGRSFTDANLHVGDRLTIGPIEFEVLHTGAPHAPSETQPRTDAQDQSSRLDEQLKSVQEEKQRWEKDLAAQRAELEGQRTSLLKQRDKLLEEADWLQKHRQEWESARAKDESRAADDKARIAKLQEELASRRTEDLSAEEPSATPIAGEAPISLENVLSKMGLDRAFEEQTPESSPSAAFIAPDRETPPAGMEKRATVAPQAAVADDQDEEESLDDYMVRLMERVRATGGSTPTIFDHEKSDYANGPNAAALSSASPQSISQTPTAQVAPDASEELEEQKTTGEKLKNLSPRVRAPEKVESLSAMRELANVSAQTAIDRHAKRQFLHAARSKLLVAGIGLLAGGVLLSLWWFLGERGVVFYGGLIAFLIALFWGFQFAAMSGKVVSTKAPAKNSSEALQPKKRGDS